MYVFRFGVNNRSGSSKLKFTVGFLIVVDDEFDAMLRSVRRRYVFNSLPASSRSSPSSQSFSPL